jgi:hypothetical protein
MVPPSQRKLSTLTYFYHKIRAGLNSNLASTVELALGIYDPTRKKRGKKCGNACNPKKMDVI